MPALNLAPCPQGHLIPYATVGKQTLVDCPAVVMKHSILKFKETAW